jgi:hypothetical protein
MMGVDMKFHADQLPKDNSGDAEKDTIARMKRYKGQMCQPKDDAVHSNRWLGAIREASSLSIGTREWLVERFIKT